MTYQYQNHLPKSDAVKVEVAITRPNGDVVRLVCDSFNYIEIEKFMEVEYLPDFYGNPQVKSLVLTIDTPRTWTVYAPQIEQPSIDDGNVVEEA